MIARVFPARGLSFPLFPSFLRRAAVLKRDAVSSREKSKTEAKSFFDLGSKTLNSFDLLAGSGHWIGGPEGRGLLWDRPI